MSNRGQESDHPNETDTNDAQGEDVHPPPFELKDIPEEEREIAERVTRAVMLETSWSGRLPRPPDLKDYNDIVPGSARELVDDLLQESKFAQQSIDLDREVSHRVLTLMEGRHELDVEESRSDRAFRDRVIDNLRYLLYLPLLLIVLVLFAPLGDIAKVIIIVGILVAYAGPVCIVLARGRMTENERDVLTSIVPQVTAAITAVIRKQDVERNASSKHIERGESSHKELDETSEP